MVDLKLSAEEISGSGLSGTVIYGWTCDRCGVFVPNGTYHACGYQYQKTQPPETYTISLDPDYELKELIKKLTERIDRLIELLERTKNVGSKS